MPGGGAVLARRIYRLLGPETASWPARLFRVVHHVLAAGGLSALVLDTVHALHVAAGAELETVFETALAFFMVEYGLRLWVAPQAPWAPQGRPWRARWHWIGSGAGLIDVLALLPLAAMLAGAPAPVVHDIGVLWILKFGRYSESLALVARVLKNARGPLESVFLAFLLVLLMAATFAHLAERGAQPDAFGSIPAALWWAVVTLTTTGYGDVVPMTPLGRVIGGMVMICGIGTFAFLAGILANSFAQEMHRREFLRTWDLVARVPFFQNVGAAAIAEVAKQLKPRDVPAGAIVARRGERGDCMYFIVSGEVSIRLEPEPLVLGEGQFFGEIALVTGSPRNATVSARTPCQLLVLDIADFRRLAVQQPDLMRAIDEEARRRLGHASVRA
jgi:voltage-gated potassium channel